MPLVYPINPFMDELWEIMDEEEEGRAKVVQVTDGHEKALRAKG
ncbi:MAG: hypothetical protein ACM32I_03370 [Nitrospirota bacterium]|jgi:hypothetical protein